MPLVLTFPPGQTQTSAGEWVGNHDLAQEIVTGLREGRDVVIPLSVDEHGNKQWELLVVNETDAILELRHCSACGWTGFGELEERTVGSVGHATCPKCGKCIGCRESHNSSSA